MSTEQFSVDVRGVLRGECTVCECKRYFKPQIGAACSVCKHVPAKHKNITSVPKPNPPASSSSAQSHAWTPQLSSKEEFARRPLRSQADPIRSSSTSHNSSTPLSTSSYTGRSTQLCQADGCNNPVHIDPQLGYFSYCSPSCRDVHILPAYNEKLKADINEFEANQSTSHKLKVKKFDVFRMVDIKTKPKELTGLTFVQLDNKKIVITGFELSKTEKYLKDGQILLLDRLTDICDIKTASLTGAEIEAIVRPRTIISMHLDGTFAVQTDIGDFLKAADKNGATHIFALWPMGCSDSYGLTVKKHAQKLDVEGISKGTSAQLCGIVFGDQVVCYTCSSYTEKRLSEICYARGSDQFYKDLKIASQQEMLPILAVVRKKLY